MNSFPAILLVLAILGALFLIVHRLPIGGEWSRKFIHIGMGTVCLSFPWLFHKAWPVDLLAILAVTSLFILRISKSDLCKVLHRVERWSLGEILFPVGVALVFRLSDGDPSLFIPPIAVLTFADPAGALIGNRWGRLIYRTNAGQKSLEGSLAVFTVSFLIVLASCVSRDLPTALLVAFMVGLIAAMSEGVLSAGADNLVLPLAVFGLIYFLEGLCWTDLLARIGVIAALSSGLFLVRRFTSLNGGGLLSVTIFGYLSFGLGGYLFLLPPLILFFVHLFTVFRFPKLHLLEHSADSVAAAVIPGLIWLTAMTSTELPVSLGFLGFTFSLACQAALLHSATFKHLDLPPHSWLCVSKVLLVTLPILIETDLKPMIFCVVTLPIIARKTTNLNRLGQSLFSLIFSIAAHLFVS